MKIPNLKMQNKGLTKLHKLYFALRKGVNLF